MKDVQIETTWKKQLSHELNESYFAELRAFVHEAYAQENVYPHPKDVFRAFNLCPFEKVKVVILGQDPYHGAGQANGMAFAVNEGVPLPPSLKNIFKEIESDLGHTIQKTGNLERWAQQGVLLLNATLTVRAHTPGSHQGKGWELFTDAAIRALSNERKHLVFMLWGRYAKEKGSMINRNDHLVLEAAHPSPFSAHHGFFGSKHFSQANAYLHAQGNTPIEW